MPCMAWRPSAKHAASTCAQSAMRVSCLQVSTQWKKQVMHVRKLAAAWQTQMSPMCWHLDFRRCHSGSSFSLDPEPVHFRCKVQYDGTGFHGFQSQRGTEKIVRTVQDELEEALRSLNRGDPVRLTAAGRTDKGVHASGQVIDFKLPWWQHGHVSMMRALNARLPKDVSVVHAEEVDSHFHSRYSASYRRYAYHIYNAPHRSPLFSRYAWHVPEKLSVERMQAAANMLLGTHDFSTFGSAPDGSGHCIREIVSIRVDRTPAPDAGPNPFGSKASSAAVSAFAGVVPSTTCFTAPSPPNRQGLPEHWARDSSIISIDIVGRSFLYHMVRNIVGALKAVGCGKDSEQGMRHRLQRRSRDACGVPAPAHGLTLTEVGFWGEDGGLSFDDWVASRPQEDVFGQRLTLGPPKPSPG